MSRDTEDVVARAIQRLTDRAAMYAATVPGQVDLKTLLADRQSLSDRIDGLTQALNSAGAYLETRVGDWPERVLAQARAALHQEGIAPVSGRNPATHEPSPVPRSRP